ncbi:MAG: choice-of-anchor L domain-containing protein, partial [Moheibacter sp.]
MRKLLLVLVFLQYLVSSQAQNASIMVNPAGSAESNFTAEQLLTDVLLDGGSCSSSSNFQLKDNPTEPFPGANRSWGYFKKGTSNFPFEEGIVLTSGYAKDAEGPDSGIVSKGGYEWLGDDDASVLALIGTNNATVFEFDFVPQGNVISFRYIFASEEYPDWVCSSFNDVFAFIISGPGIT